MYNINNVLYTESFGVTGLKDPYNELNQISRIYSVLLLL